MSLVDKVINENKQYPELRLGQYFVCAYIKGQWSSLFSCSSTPRSAEMIDEWLRKHHYFDRLPEKLPKWINENEKKR